MSAPSAVSCTFGTFIAQNVDSWPSSWLLVIGASNVGLFLSNRPAQDAIPCRLSDISGFL